MHEWFFRHETKLKMQNLKAASAKMKIILLKNILLLFIILKGQTQMLVEDILDGLQIF